MASLEAKQTSCSGLAGDIAAQANLRPLRNCICLHYSMRHLMWQAGDTANDTLSCEVDEGTLPSRRCRSWIRARNRRKVPTCARMDGQ